MNEYDARQYRRMLMLLEDYQEGDISLSQLAGDIEGLIFALEGTSDDLQDELLALWSPIEIAYARQCDGEKLQPSDHARLGSHIQDLRTAILTRLGH